jgi:crotonobetainyl-CoA:carnitine CoA-transferase CaiB-like acyl-CoA transferase
MTTSATTTDTDAQTPTALGGLRVVDFSRFLPAGYVSWMFADMGADVIRIEHPRELAKQTFVAGAEGESEDAAAYRRALSTQNRNKRSLLINPGNARSREVICELIKTADVLLEDYRPGVLAKMGYPYDEMAKLNPRLVYVSVSFAGQTGPYSGRAGHDPLALSLAGALSRLNGTPVPTLPGLQVADVCAGAHATIATLMALQARERTGKGQHVDVAMSDACWPLSMVTMARNPDPTKLPPLGQWQPKGGVWECADGQYSCTTDMETLYWKRFCEVVGRPEFFDLMHATDQHPAMQAELKAIFKTRTRDEWTGLLTAADTQVMPVFNLAEALEDPHNHARGMVVDVPFGDRVIRQIGTPFHLSETPGQIRHLATPAGAHSGEILAELGYSEAETEMIRAAGGFDG